MKNLKRKDAMQINNTLLISFKKAAAYTNRKFEKSKVTFEYEFLVADDTIVLYYSGLPTNRTIPINIMEVLDCFNEKVISNLPNRIEIGDDSYRVYILPSVIASKNDVLFHILANSYSVTIPTSCRCGMNIVSVDKSHSLYGINEFMRENRVWFWRYEDGPNACSDEEDDCTLLEYVISTLRYI